MNSYRRNTLDEWNRTHLRRGLISIAVVTGFRGSRLPDSLHVTQYRVAIRAFLDSDGSMHQPLRKAELVDVLEAMGIDVDRQRTNGEFRRLIANRAGTLDEYDGENQLRKPELKEVAAALAADAYDNPEDDVSSADDERGLLTGVLGR